MAALSPVYWETVTPGLRTLLEALGPLSWMESFYLAGGTALALRIGHRRSIDLDLMKLDAVIGRGGRKDFIDLYYIVQHHPLESLLDLSRTKYPYARDFPLMAVESLLRFDNADRDNQPEMLDDTDWASVRAFFVAEARRMGGAW